MVFLNYLAFKYLSLRVPAEGYSRNVPAEGYSRNVPDEGYSRNVPDEGYSSNVSSTLNLISTFQFLFEDALISLANRCYL